MMSLQFASTPHARCRSRLALPQGILVRWLPTSAAMNAALSALLVLAITTTVARSQAPDVPVYEEGPGARPLATLSKQAKKLRESGLLLSAEKAKEQSKRTSCLLTLPTPSTQKLDTREVWQRARKSHMRVGWIYLCNECDRWHLSLSGGYAITSDTVATCAHVIEPLEMREGYLIAADDDDKLYAVTEVLANNPALDTAIVRLKAGSLSPLPLGKNVLPGDTVFCFSDPVDRRGYFSQGMVNRFVKRPFLRKKEVQDAEKASASNPDSSTASAPAKAPLESPVWIEVSTEWAPGSSGSAVLDTCGNAVGHVSEIEAVLEDPLPNAKRAAKARGTVIIFHDAIAASNVLSLIKPPPPGKPAPPK